VIRVTFVRENPFLPILVTATDLIRIIAKSTKPGILALILFLLSYLILILYCRSAFYRDPTS
jgi:hypothetical protein